MVHDAAMLIFKIFRRPEWDAFRAAGETLGAPIDLADGYIHFSTAAQVAEMIRQTGGKVVASVRLFDVFRSAQIGEGKKSLAYSLSYQASDRTLTDKDVSGIRQRIVRRLEQELGARLRS